MMWSEASGEEVEIQVPRFRRICRGTSEGLVDDREGLGEAK